MMNNTKEMILRFTLDSIPQKILNYQEEYQKENPKKKYFLYKFLYDEVITKGHAEPYYGGSKKSAQQRMSNINKGDRKAMTSTPIRLIAENMGLSVSELLWGKEKNWKPLLPALFYLVIFDALNTTDKGSKDKLSLQDRAIEALKPSVIFASELAKKEIACDFSYESISFDIHDKKLAQVIFRLYQPQIEQKFYELFRREFIDCDYELGYLDAKLKVFAHQVIDEIEKWNSEQLASVSDSLGYQVYKTYNLYFSFESQEHFASFTSRAVLERELKKESEEYADIQLLHYLDEEQAIMYRSIENFVNEISKVQAKQDKRLGIHLADKAIFKKAFDSVGFNKEYFEKSTIEIDNRRLSQEELNEQIKQAVKDATLPI